MDDLPQAEVSLLGAIIHEPGIVEGLGLTADLFYDPQTRATYLAILRLLGDELEVEPVALAGALRDLGRSDCIAFATSIESWTSANAAYYAAELRKARDRRRLGDALTDARRSLEEGREPQEIAQGLASSFEPSPLERTPEPLTMSALCERLEHEREGIDTGLAALKAKGIVLPRGAITIVAARPGAGKTSMMLSLARLLSDSMTVAFYSYEEPVYRLAVKIALGMLGAQAPQSSTAAWATVCRKLRGLGSDELIPRDDGLLREYLERMRAAMIKKIGTSLLLFEAPRTVEDLCAAIRRERRRTEDKLGLVLLDYVQLVHLGTDSYSRQTELAAISAKLRDLAKAEDIAIVAGAQITRGQNEEAAYLREADDILNDANLVLVLARKGSAEAAVMPYEVIVAKSRDGVSGVHVPLAFRGRCRQFLDPGQLTAEELDIYERQLVDSPTAGTSSSGRRDPMAEAAARGLQGRRATR